MRKVQRGVPGVVAASGRDVATAARSGMRQPPESLGQQRKVSQGVSAESLLAARLKQATQSFRNTSLKRTDCDNGSMEQSSAKRNCKTNGDVLKNLAQYSVRTLDEEMQKAKAAKAAASSSSATASTSARAHAAAQETPTKTLPQVIGKLGHPDTAQPKRRSVVRQKILDALSRGNKDRLPLDVNDIATEVEEALHSTFKDNEKDYTNKARSVLFNLNDSRNLDFRSKLLVGFISPADVPHLSSEDMASHEKEVGRAKMRKESMEEIQTDWDLKHGLSFTQGMFTCGRCKSTKTSYYQLQTRSSDEPMTTFVCCLNCGKRWKC